MPPISLSVILYLVAQAWLRSRLNLALLRLPCIYNLGFQLSKVLFAARPRGEEARTDADFGTQYVDVSITDKEPPSHLHQLVDKRSMTKTMRVMCLFA